MEKRSQERIKEETITAIGYLPALTKTTKLSDVSTYTLCLLQHVGMQDSLFMQNMMQMTRALSSNAFIPNIIMRKNKVSTEIIEKGK
jgi:hypothetical protein